MNEEKEIYDQKNMKIETQIGEKPWLDVACEEDWDLGFI